MKIKRTTKHVDVFKPLKKGDRVTCAYLYADGHATVSFERRIPDTDTTVRYYKQIDTLGFPCHFRTGRIVFSYIGGGVSWLRCMIAAGVDAISARPADLDGGSPNTKAKGIPVGYVTAHTPFGDVTDYDMPGALSGTAHYQTDISEQFDPRLDRYPSDAAVAETLLTRTVCACPTCSDTGGTHDAYCDACLTHACDTNPALVRTICNRPDVITIAAAR